MINWSWDMVAVLAVTAACGAVGGLVHELLRTHGKQDGMLEKPHRKGLYVILGWGASVIVGAVAAIAILYFISPGQTITTTGTGGAKITTSNYDLIKVVALALIAGSAGASLLTSLQSRLAALITAADLSRTQSSAVSAVDQFKTNSLRTFKEANAGAIEAVSAQAHAVINHAANQLPPQLEAAGPAPGAVAAAVDDIRQHSKPAEPDADAKEFEDYINSTFAALTERLDHRLTELAGQANSMIKTAGDTTVTTSTN